MKGFYDRLRPDLDSVLRSFQGEYEMYSHKTFKFAKYLREVATVHLVTELESSIVTDVHLGYEADPQARVDRWIAEAADEPILVFHDASKLAVYPRSTVSADSPGSR